MDHLHSCYCSNVLRLFIVQDQHVCSTRVHVYVTELTCTQYRIYMSVCAPDKFQMNNVLCCTMEPLLEDTSEIRTRH